MKLSAKAWNRPQKRRLSSHSFLCWRMPGCWKLPTYVAALINPIFSSVLSGDVLRLAESNGSLLPGHDIKSHLPAVHWDQLWAQRLVMSMGELSLFYTFPCHMSDQPARRCYFYFVFFTLILPVDIYKILENKLIDISMIFWIGGPNGTHKEYVAEKLMVFCSCVFNLLRQIRYEI